MLVLDLIDIDDCRFEFFKLQLFKKIIGTAVDFYI